MFQNASRHYNKYVLLQYGAAALRECRGIDVSSDGELGFCIYPLTCHMVTRPVQKPIPLPGDYKACQRRRTDPAGPSSVRDAQVLLDQLAPPSSMACSAAGRTRICQSTSLLPLCRMQTLLDPPLRRYSWVSAAPTQVKRCGTRACMRLLNGGLV